MFERNILYDEILSSSLKQEELVIIFRNANQQFLFNLYNSKDSIETINNKEIYKIYNTLVGVAFALWRAAFFTMQKRTEIEIFNHGCNVLKLLIDHNSITYKDEHNNSKWMLGYYLNNSKLRILQVEKKLNKLKISNTINFELIEEVSLTKISDLNKAWIIFHNTVVEILRLITAYKK